MYKILSFFIAKFVSTFYYLFLRERERQSGSGGGVERGRQNPKQAPGSDLSAQSPKWGLNS